DLIISYCARGPTPGRSHSAARLRRVSLRRLARAQGCSIDAYHAAVGLSSLEQLQLIQRRVRAVGLREQLVVPADFDDAAALEHDDRVGAADRRQPVGDD